MGEAHHIMEDKLFTHSPRIAMLTSRNIFTETARIMFDQIPGHYGPAEMTHRINHHTWIKDRGGQGPWRSI